MLGCSYFGFIRKKNIGSKPMKDTCWMHVINYTFRLSIQYKQIKLNDFERRFESFSKPFNFFNSFGLQAPFLKLLIQPHSLRRTLAKKTWTCKEIWKSFYSNTLACEFMNIIFHITQLQQWHWMKATMSGNK